MAYKKYDYLDVLDCSSAEANGCSFGRWLEVRKFVIP